MSTVKSISYVLVSTILLVIVVAMVVSKQTNHYKAVLTPKSTPKVVKPVSIDNDRDLEKYLECRGIVRE